LIKTFRSWNSALGNNLGNFFSKQKQNRSSIWNTTSGITGRRKSDASSLYSITSSIMSADANKLEDSNYEKGGEKLFQCECGGCEFKAFVNKDGKSKLVCADCNKVA